MADWKKICRRNLITLAVVYGILCACVFVFQRSLIYIPSKIPADALESVAKDHGFVLWKNPAGQIIGAATLPAVLVSPHRVRVTALAGGTLFILALRAR